MPEIREVLFPPEVEEKLWSLHGLTQWEVEQVIFDPESEPRWDIDEEHGARVILRGALYGDPSRTVFVSLRPIDPEYGVWACVTAFVPTNPEYGAEPEGE